MPSPYPCTVASSADNVPLADAAAASLAAASNVVVHYRNDLQQDREVLRAARGKDFIHGYRATGSNLAVLDAAMLVTAALPRPGHLCSPSNWSPDALVDYIQNAVDVWLFSGNTHFSGSVKGVYRAFESRQSAARYFARWFSAHRAQILAQCAQRARGVAGQ